MRWRRLRGLIVFLLLPTGFRGQSSPPSRSFEELIAQARDAAESERIDQAVELYRQATATRPDWTEGWWRLGGLFYYSERFAESSDAFRRFVAHEQKSGPGFAMMGLCEFELKHYQPALVALEQALRLGVGFNPELQRQALYRDATLQSLLGRQDIAVKRLTLALNLAAAANPGADAKSLIGDVDLIDALGIAALRMARLPSEVQPEKSALVRKAGRAQALVSLHDWVSAAGEFKQLAASFGNEPGVHFMFGIFLLKEHPSDALGEFEKEIQVSPHDVDARLQIALECLRTGDYERCRKNVSEAVGLAPGNFVGHLVSARLWLALDNLDRALEEAETAVRLAADSPDAHFTLSHCYARADRSEEAERERGEYRRLRSLAQGSGQ